MAAAERSVASSQVRTRKPPLTWVKQQMQQITRHLKDLTGCISEARGILERLFEGSLDLTGYKNGIEILIDVKRKGNALKLLVSIGCPYSVIAIRGIEL